MKLFGVQEMKNFFKNKVKAVGLLLLMETLYLFPDFLFSSRGIFLLSKLFENYDNFAYWAYPMVKLIGFVIALVIAYKMGFFFQIRESFRLKNILLLLLFVVSALIIAYFMESYIFLNFPSAFYNAPNISGYNFLAQLPVWFSVLLLSVLAPIFEEIIFRKCLYQLFNNDKLAFIISVVLFAWIHTGFSIWFIYYLPSSLAITYAYHRHKRLTDSIFVHMGNNILMSYIFTCLNTIFKFIS